LLVFVLNNIFFSCSAVSGCFVLHQGREAGTKQAGGGQEGTESVKAAGRVWKARCVTK
jgi:hypothetical protein